MVRPLKRAVGPFFAHLGIVTKIRLGPGFWVETDEQGLDRKEGWTGVLQPSYLNAGAAQDIRGHIQER